jgi:hypothetical protein
MNIENEESSWIKFQKSGRGDTLGWGLIFLWGAIVVLIEMTTDVKSISGWDGWAVFFIGFGVIALFGAVVGVQIKDHAKAVWNGIVGFFALSFGLGTILETDAFWALALFGVALVLIYAASNNNWDEKEEKNGWC